MELQTDSELLREELREKSIHLSRLKSDYDQLLETVHAQHDALDEAVRQLEKYTETYAPWMNEKKEIEKKFKQLRNENLDLSACYQEHKTQIAQLQQVLKDQKAEITTLNADKSKLEQIVNEKSYQMSKQQEVKAQLEYELRSCLEKLALAQHVSRPIMEEKSTYKEKSELLEKDLNEVKKQISDLQTDNQSLRHENTSLRQEASKSIQELMSVMSKCNDYQSKLQQMSSELDNSQSECLKYKQEAQASHDELEELRKECRTMSNKLIILENRNKELQLTNDALIDRRPLLPSMNQSGKNQVDTCLTHRESNSDSNREFPSSYQAAHSSSLRTTDNNASAPMIRDGFSRSISKTAEKFSSTTRTEIPKVKFSSSHRQYHDHRPSILEDTFIVEEKRQSDHVVNAFSSHIDNLEKSLLNIFPPKRG